MNAQQSQMDVISNNLANVSTNGFKELALRGVRGSAVSDRPPAFGANSARTPRSPSGIQLGTGVQQVATERLYTQGNLQQTGNSKDVAINGQGFFRVTMPDGTDGLYARRLVSDQRARPARHVERLPGDPGDHGADQRDVASPSAADGVVSITVAGSHRQPSSSARCRSRPSSTRPVSTPRVKTCSRKRHRRVRRERRAAWPERRGHRCNQGYVEASNVNVVQELVNMIQTQRAYEINSKAVTTSDQMLQTLCQMQI